MNGFKIKYHLAMLKYINIDYIVIKKYIKSIKKMLKIKKNVQIFRFDKKMCSNYTSN